VDKTASLQGLSFLAARLYVPATPALWPEVWLRHASTMCGWMPISAAPCHRVIKS
jgi:hypothetical protein